MKTKRKMSEHDKQCADRLQQVWNNKKRALGLTQEKIANAMGWANASAFGAYLHGRIPMNLNAKLKLAEVLQIDPTTIDPELPEWSVVRSEELSDDERQLLSNYGKLPEKLKEMILVQISALTMDLQNKPISH